MDFNFFFLIFFSTNKKKWIWHKNIQLIERKKIKLNDGTK